MDWLVIGSAPSVLDWMEPIFRQTHMSVVTCNSGIKLCAVPTAYLLCDQKACQAYQEQARYAHRFGTRLVTLKRVQSSLEERGVDWFDEFLELGRGEPTESEWGCFRYTGPLCIEYACRRGATAVHLVGMTGYRHDNDYFDPDHPRLQQVKDQWITHTVSNLAPRTQRLVDLFRDVQFFCYSQPVYNIIADNWTVVHAGNNPSSRRFLWSKTQEYVPD